MMTSHHPILLVSLLVAGVSGSYGEERSPEPKAVNPPSPTVQQVRIIGTEAGELEKILQLTSGAVFDPHMLARDLAAIEKLSLYSSARAEIARNDDGAIRVTFIVVRKPAGPPE